MRIPILVALAALAGAPRARAATPGEEAARSYRVDTAGTTTAIAGGAAGKLVLAIVPGPGVHVHPQAPLRVVVDAPGLALAKATLGHRDAVDPRAEGPRFELPFTAPAAGTHVVKATLDFFVCSDRWCVKQVRELAVQIEVSEAAGVGGAAHPERSGEAAESRDERAGGAVR